MKRLTYIYWATPLFVLLGCGRFFEGLLGATGALIAGLILVLALWGVVWLRLYGMNRVRPEFAVLAILPQAIYYIAQALPKDEMSMFTGAAWQNMYFLCWLGTIAVGILSLRPGRQDTRRPVRQDAAFLLMSALLTLFSLGTWASYAGEMFPL